MTTHRTRTALVGMAVVAALAVGVGVLALRLDTLRGYRVPGYPSAPSPSRWLDVKQLLGLERFYSQLGQDKWILGRVHPETRDGYFVDIGSWDAEVHSNSKALEERGWNGICIDPFPRNWTGRSCQLFREVVYSRAGEIVSFRKGGPMGGIDEHLGGQAAPWIRRNPVVEFRTTTIGDVLRRAGAPRFVHYVSIDTEGSELEILSAWPFEEYVVGAFTVEHNFEEPKRTRIRELLETHGYRLARTQIVDDWYAHRDLPRLPR